MQSCFSLVCPLSNNFPLAWKLLIYLHERTSESAHQNAMRPFKLACWSTHNLSIMQKHWHFEKNEVTFLTFQNFNKIWRWQIRFYQHTEMPTMQLVSYFEFSIFIFILKSHDLLEVLVRIFGLVASQQDPQARVKVFQIKFFSLHFLVQISDLILNLKNPYRVPIS